MWASTLLAITAAVIGCGHPAADMPRDVPSNRVPSATAVFCAYGGVGTMPDPLPPGYETEFAVAVVDIDSPESVAHASVEAFALFDRDGTVAPMKRVVEMEIFERPRDGSEGWFAYYLNPGGTRPWTGALPAGRIRIRIRVSLERALFAPVRFRLVIDGLVVEGRIDGGWPT